MIMENKGLPFQCTLKQWETKFTSTSNDYCHFHKHKGFSTGRCSHLHQEIQRLVEMGYFQEYFLRRDYSDAPRDVNRTDRVRGEHRVREELLAHRERNNIVAHIESGPTYDNHGDNVVKYGRIDTTSQRTYGRTQWGCTRSHGKAIKQADKREINHVESGTHVITFDESEAPPPCSGQEWTSDSSSIEGLLHVTMQVLEERKAGQRE